MTDHTQQIATAIDKHFEDLAHVLDEIASQHDLDSKEMLESIRFTNFGGVDFYNYYSDWMQGTWEPAVANLPL